MGCCTSKTEVEFTLPGGQNNQLSPADRKAATAGDEGLGRLLVGGKRVPPTLEEAQHGEEHQMARNPRLSIKYQSKELSGRMGSRRSSTPFDRARIGTHTRHGVMPGPRGFSAAKINQDRGVVCWPFNGSYNQALLCVFDGHGSKGERASEFCMKHIPESLEAEAKSLKEDPSATLSRVVIQTDKDLLAMPELGRLAMTCGTTSTVCYFHGNECYTACSGDSRAVKGYRKGGAILAEDLSNDHKPDLPEERARITAAGGTVSDGSAGRPSRVWAHGRIGLAMSRSIGDGECKHVGVIPDPEISRIIVTPADTADGDGDLFVIVASDGVWEFITSEEACHLVVKYKNATEACSALVLEATQRWKRFEGSYRDDITAIIAYLPFLESGWEGDEDTELPGDEEATAAVFLNEGQQGISWSNRMSVAEPTSETDEEAQSSQASTSDEFAARRLSVHNPYDEDWNEVSADGEEDAGGEAEVVARV